MKTTQTLHAKSQEILMRARPNTSYWAQRGLTDEFHGSVDSMQNIRKLKPLVSYLTRLEADQLYLKPVKIISDGSMVNTEKNSRFTTTFSHLYMSSSILSILVLLKLLNHGSSDWLKWHEIAQMKKNKLLRCCLKQSQVSLLILF